MPASSVFFTFVISVHDPFYGKTRIIRVRYPGPRICRTFAQNCAAVSSQGLPEIRSPLGAAQKPTGPPGLLHGEVAKPTAPPGLLHGEARKPTAPPGLLRGEAQKPTTPPGLLHGKAQKPTAPPGLLHGEVRKPTTAVAFARPRAFPAARPAGTARFLITREKASFYETATFGRRKVFFCSPFCGLLFCPTRAKLALPAGKSPPPRNPGRPAAAPPNDRDRLPVFAPPAQTPAPATPPQSACSRRLSGCPQRPNLSARRRAESPKGKRKGGTPDETRTAALTTAPPEDGWEGSQPKRAQRRGKPAKQPRRSAS